MGGPPQAEAVGVAVLLGDACVRTCTWPSTMMVGGS